MQTGEVFFCWLRGGFCFVLLTRKQQSVVYHDSYIRCFLFLMSGGFQARVIGFAQPEGGRLSRNSCVVAADMPCWKKYFLTLYLIGLLLLLRNRTVPQRYGGFLPDTFAVQSVAEIGRRGFRCFIYKKGEAFYFCKVSGVSCRTNAPPFETVLY